MNRSVDTTPNKTAADGSTGTPEHGSALDIANSGSVGSNNDVSSSNSIISPTGSGQNGSGRIIISTGYARIMWSNEEIASIIQEVRDRPFLYDKKHSDYKHHQKKELAWDTIATKMQNKNLTGECGEPDAVRGVSLY